MGPTTWFHRCHCNATKDNTKKSFLSIDTKIGGKRHYKKTRYTENTKKDVVSNTTK